MPQCISVESYNSKQQKSVERILESLDNMNDRQVTVYSRHRAYERKKIRGYALVRIVNTDNIEQAIEFRVYIHNVSSGGMCFICPDEIQEKDVLIGLLKPDNTPSVWFKSQIVRKKEIIEEGFWEYGVAFKSRLEF
jgi:hypothetical protein